MIGILDSFVYSSEFGICRETWNIWLYLYLIGYGNTVESVEYSRNRVPLHEVSIMISILMKLNTIFVKAIPIFPPRDQKQSTKTEVNEVIEEEYIFMATGLNTSLNPTFGVKTAKHVSDNLEGFLSAVEKTLIKEAFKRRRFEQPNRKTSEIYDVLQELKNLDTSAS